MWRNVSTLVRIKKNEPFFILYESFTGTSSFLLRPLSHQGRIYPKKKSNLRRSASDYYTTNIQSTVLSTSENFQPKRILRPLKRKFTVDCNQVFRAVNENTSEMPFLFFSFLCRFNFSLFGLHTAPCGQCIGSFVSKPELKHLSPKVSKN